MITEFNFTDEWNEEKYVENFPIDFKVGGNYYGGLFIMENEGKYYWLIENYDTNFDDLSDWSEIDKELYDSLVAYEARMSS